MLHSISPSLILMPFRRSRVERTLDLQSGLCRRGASLDDARRSVSGRPRQFCVTWQNMRCSILFHLDVPGGSGGHGARACLVGELLHSPSRAALAPVRPPRPRVVSSAFWIALAPIVRASADASTRTRRVARIPTLTIRRWPPRRRPVGHALPSSLSTKSCTLHAADRPWADSRSRLL